MGLTIYQYFQPDKELVLEFIEKNPEKAALQLIRNDTPLASVAPNRPMPLASTVKIILAIEYAEQAADGLVNPEEQVALSELERFYVPDTDGGAHPRWMQSLETSGGQVDLREVVRGMIWYSSNANTEWLCEKLGLEAINARLDSLGMREHSKIYYPVSSLFIGEERFPDQTGKALAEKWETVEEEAYIDLTRRIHEKLKSDTAYRKSLGDLTMVVQKAWSDRLPRSTVAEYAELMARINSRTYFQPEVHLHLDGILEILMENPANREWLARAGAKGGSTAFVLTKALYATDKQGNQTQLAYFLNDLGPLDMIRLRKSMNDFELSILTSKSFRREMTEKLGIMDQH